MIDKPIKPIEDLYADARAAAVETESLSEWRSYGYEDIKTWTDTRAHCCSDLFWFATEILGYDLVEFHRFVTTEFFIQKDPSVEVYRLSPKKTRLILYPRGSFKSSIDEADTVQWIIAYPNIRIGLMTATDDLGTAFVEKIKGFFQVPEQTRLTQFQMLFFEHCVPARKKEASNSFITRARTKKLLTQPTLENLSLKASTSGFHYDIGKFDDPVSNGNSGPGTTAEQRKTVYEQLRFGAALIDPFGYRFYLGTPYNDDDAWSYLKAKTRNLVLLQKPAVIIKASAKAKSFLDLEDDDVELLFPEDRTGTPRHTLEYLKGEYQADEYIFNCNYLLDPNKSKVVHITEQLINSRIVTAGGLPQAGTYRIFSAWDFADSLSRTADFSVGVVGLLDCFGRLFIVEVVRGKFSPSELAFKVADQAARWRVERIYIEKSPGADFLQNDIMRELVRLGYGDCPLPEWFPVDNQKGAKEKRFEMLESYLVNQVLWFSVNISSEDPEMMDTITNELSTFKPNSKRKDDIGDAIAHLCRVIPATVSLPKTEQEASNIVWELLAQKQLHDRYFGVRENTSLPITDVPLTQFDGPDGMAPVCCPHCGFSPCIGT